MNQEQNNIQLQLLESFKNHKEQVALSCRDVQYTYGELEALVSAYSHYLGNSEVKTHELVGILVNDRTEAIMLMVASLFARVVFVPLDRSHPSERLINQLKQVDCQHVFLDKTDTTLIDACRKNGVTSHLLSEVPRSVGVSLEVEQEYQPKDPIYLYFTSGTEGQQKGVLGSNLGLTHFLDWERNQFNLQPGVRVSNVSSIGFDASLRDIFLPLTIGGTVCIPDGKEVLLDPQQFSQWIDREKVEVIHCVPSLFRNVNHPDITKESYPSLKYVFLAGERIIPNELENWYAQFDDRIKIINLYGASEVTMAKSFYIIQPGDVARTNIPVGKAMKGAQLVVLKENLKKCLTLEEGEIYIRTPYRTLGYYLAPDLNQQKFIQNPYSQNPEDLLYKTGDMGRMRPDGNLEFLGRIDNQVKIRGNRVNLGEIENHALKHDGISKCAVVDVEQEGDTQIALYYQVQNGPLDSKEVLAFLSPQLTEYMVPTYITEVKSIPLTVNGKVDYKALPEPKLVTVPLVAPETPVEEAIREVWAEVLKVPAEALGVETKFFEAGGNSLKLMTLISKICRKMEVRLPLGKVLNQPTIRHMASILDAGPPTESKGIQPAASAEHYPLSESQKGIYYALQSDLNTTAYNVTEVMRFDQLPATDVLLAVFDALLERHDILRTSIVEIGGTPAQKIGTSKELEWVEQEGSLDDFEKFKAGFIAPFDLANGPLLRIGIFHNNSGGGFLILDASHIILDGLSLEILKKEFETLLQGKSLKEVTIQYKDFAVWQAERKKSGKEKEGQQFWKSHFKQWSQAELPLDHPRESMKTFDGKFARFQLDPQQTAALSELAQRSQVTPYTVLLSAFYILLYKVAGEHDLTVGIPLSGRIDPAVEEMVGMFVNTLPLRMAGNSEHNVAKVLVDTNESLQQIMRHQDYQLNEIADLIGYPISASRNPLFDVVFNYVDFNIDRTAGAKSKDHTQGLGQFDLTLYAINSGDQIGFNFDYNAKLYTAGTIDKYIEYYQSIIDQIVTAQDMNLGDIKFFKAEEKSSMYSIGAVSR